MPSKEEVGAMQKVHMFLDSYKNTGHVNMLTSSIDILIGIAGSVEKRRGPKLSQEG